MNFGFLAFLILITFKFDWVEATSEIDCGLAQRRIRLSADYAKEFHTRRDVSEDVELIEKTLKACGLNPSPYGWGPGLFSYWKNKGYQAELKRLETQIIHLAQFKDVSSELDLYMKYANKLNIKSAVSFYEKYLTLGKISGPEEERKCQTAIDLRGDALGEVRNQGDLGWCYAFAAADLLTYKLGQRISAADLAMINNDTFINTVMKKINRSETEFEGSQNDGIEKTILKAKEKGGACLEKNLKSDENGEAILLEHLNQIHRMKIKSDAQPSDQGYQSVQKIFPTIQRDDISKILLQTSRSERVTAFREKACTPRLSLKNLTVTRLNNDGLAIFNEIDKQLTDRNILGIVFDNRYIRNQNSQGADFSGHAATIVGRRYNKKNAMCEYLIRNTRGQDETLYDRDYQVEKGSVWMPKSVLAKALVNINFLSSSR